MYFFIFVFEIESWIWFLDLYRMFCRFYGFLWDFCIPTPRHCRFCGFLWILCTFCGFLGSVFSASRIVGPFWGSVSGVRILGSRFGGPFWGPVLGSRFGVPNSGGSSASRMSYLLRSRSGGPESRSGGSVLGVPFWGSRFGVRILGSVFWGLYSGVRILGSVFWGPYSGVCMFLGVL